MILKNEWVKNEIREKSKKILETNENELTTTQNLWDTAKAVQRGKFIAIQAYLKRYKHFKQTPDPMPTRTRGTTTKTAQSKRKEGNN